MTEISEISEDSRGASTNGHGTPPVTPEKRFRSIRSALLVSLVLILAGGSAAETLSAQSTSGGANPAATYWIYVLAESADRMHRIRFGPEGAVIEKTTAIGYIPVTTEGPHGVQLSQDGEHLYLTTGHGNPDGKFWKYDPGPDTVVAGPIDLGFFPATVDVTPEGLYGFVGNFNLHGAMIPSTVSVVYLPTFEEVAQTETCTMPHGSRISADGLNHYSVCMMDDQLVELSTRDFQVSRRFSVEQHAEGPIDADADAAGGGMAGHAGHAAGSSAPGDGGTLASATTSGAEPMTDAPTCTPTWAVPSRSGDRIFVACNATDEILEIDRAEWSLVRRFATGRGPYNLEVTPDDRLLIATLKQGHGVEFIDLEAGRRVAQVESSTSITHGVVVSPDGRYAFLSVEGIGAEPGKVDIYDLRTFERVAEVDVGQQAAGIAFWKMQAPEND